MGLIALDTRRVPIPHEPGEWMDLRARLAPAEVEAAAEEKLLAMLRIAGAAGKDGLASFGGGQKASSSEPGTIERAGVDLDTLAATALAGWSYDAPATMESIKRLDAETRGWLHDQAWEAGRPRTMEEEEGNSARSTAS